MGGSGGNQGWEVKRERASIKDINSNLMPDEEKRMTLTALASCKNYETLTGMRQRCGSHRDVFLVRGLVGIGDKVASIDNGLSNV